MIIEQESAQIGYGPAKRDPQGLLMTQLARDALAIVLAGGRGSRLGPLTDWRAKPAVPFGGKFRIIDFSLSNCVNSGIRRIGICTQYKAQSLIRHVQRGWSFLDGRFGEFVELLPAQQRVTVGLVQRHGRRGLPEPRHPAPPRAGVRADPRRRPRLQDGLRADARRARRPPADMIDRLRRGADQQTRSEYGVMALDDESRVVGFEEKPAQPKPAPGHTDIALASMGIYVFNASFLYEQLIRDADDPDRPRLRKDVIPYLVARGYRVFGHRFADSCVNMVEGRPYWRDVGTIDAYWEANLDLTHVTPDLNLYDEDWPIWSYQEQLPPAKFVFEVRDRPAWRSTRWYPAAASSADHRFGARCCSPMSMCTATARSRIRWSCPMSRCIATSRSGTCVVDRYCVLPAGLEAGVDPAQDRQRFFVTDRGVTLITPEMLGQDMHHLR